MLHTVTASTAIDLQQRVLIIESQGQFLLSASFTTAGGFTNWGNVISSERMSFDPPAKIRNHGAWVMRELHCYFALGYTDTLLNTGSIDVADTARVYASFPIVINAGEINGGLFEIPVLYNEGTFSANDLYSSGVCSNSGSLSCSHYLWVWSSFSAESGSTTMADTIIITGGMDLYQADVIAHRLFSTGTPTMNFGTVEVPTLQTLYCEGDFINYGEVTGSGDICVQGLTANYGQITSTPDICDQTLTATSPPFLDINTGAVGPNVNWCPSANCSTLGLGNDRRPETLSLAPNPATDRLTINGLPGSGPWNVQLFDLQGRTQTVRIEQRSDGVVLHRDGLAAGCFTVVVAGDAGGLRSAARVVFADR
jgi:hypothetical protein